MEHAVPKALPKARGADVVSLQDYQRLHDARGANVIALQDYLRLQDAWVSYFSAHTHTPSIHI